jgi:hypothetical protein
MVLGFYWIFKRISAQMCATLCAMNQRELKTLQGLLLLEPPIGLEPMTFRLRISSDPFIGIRWISLTHRFCWFVIHICSPQFARIEAPSRLLTHK